MQNVVYKMLEKYHYLKLLKKCKKILDDGEVSDDEIDSLKYVDDAQSEARAVGEALNKDSTWYSPLEGSTPTQNY